MRILFESNPYFQYIQARRIHPAQKGMTLAHRIEALDREPAELEERIDALLVATVPDVLDVFGVGPDTAAALVMAAGENPERLHSEAAWAHLWGVAPVPDGSGKTSGRVKAHEGGRPGE